MLQPVRGSPLPLALGLRSLLYNIELIAATLPCYRHHGLHHELSHSARHQPQLRLIVASTRSGLSMLNGRRFSMAQQSRLYMNNGRARKVLNRWTSPRESRGSRDHITHKQIWSIVESHQKVV